MQTAQRLVSFYERGLVTSNELLHALVEQITGDNAADVVAILPQEILERTRAYIAEMPQMEEGWADLRLFRIWSWQPGTTNDKIEAVRAEERRIHRRGVEILRDVFGPLPPPVLAPSLLTWNNGLIRRLAGQAYEHQIMPAGTLDPDRLAVLSDALEEAGADAALVAHLREPGPHYRGCHVVDLLTGRT